MTNKYFWKHSDQIFFPQANHSLECEFLVVGGGITGLTLAYELGVIAGKEVILVEGNQVGSGATGHSAGMLSAETERYSWADLIERLGKKHALEFAQGLHKALHFVKSFVESTQLSCEFEEEPYYFFSPKGEEEFFLNEDFLARQSLKIPSRLLKGDQLKRSVFTSNTFSLGQQLHQSYCLNPVLFAQGFAQHLSSRNVQVYEHSPFLMRGTPSVNGFPVSARKIILATDAWGETKSMQRYLTTIAVTHRLSSTVREKLHLLTVKSFEEFSSQMTYHYGRMTSDGCLLVGYGDQQVPSVDHPSVVNLRHFESIKAFLEGLFPGHPFRFQAAWSSVYGASRNLDSTTDLRQPIIYCGGAGTQVHSIYLARKLAANLLHF